jgi:hypothetical protein
MIAPEHPDQYYAVASVRLGETGIVVLHFAVGPDGKAKTPITHDEPFIVDPSLSRDARLGLRLIESAENYIRAAKFDTRGFHKRQMTASFVFEVKPCGTLEHSRVSDYAINLCRERPPPNPMPAPHCRVINGLIQC